MLNQLPLLMGSGLGKNVAFDYRLKILRRNARFVVVGHITPEAFSED